LRNYGVQRTGAFVAQLAAPGDRLRERSRTDASGQRLRAAHLVSEDSGARTERLFIRYRAASP
jgi:hypothetical protein